MISKLLFILKTIFAGSVVACFFPDLARALPNMLVYGPNSGCYADSTPGYNVTVWNAAQWASATAAQFAAFNVIVFGDCSGGSGCFTDPTLWNTAIANESVWTPAVTGNVVIVGSDPDFHIAFSGVNVGVVQNFVNFAAGGSGTGAYIALSCIYQSTAPGTAVPLLGGFGTFTVEGANTGVGGANQADIIAASPALTGITNAMLSNWNYSVHEGFDSWPASFVPLAMATDASDLNYTAPDGTNGLVYVMARGVTYIPTPTFTSLPCSGNTCTPTGTPTITPTYTPSSTPTATLTFSPTFTPSFSPTLTATFTPTQTFTKTATFTPTNTATQTPTKTATFTPTNTTTPTPTNTPCGYPGNTCTWTPTFTPTATPYTADIFDVTKNVLRSGESVSIFVNYTAYPGEYDLLIYNSAGEHIKTLDSQPLTGPVSQWYSWDGKNKYNDECASGVYLIHVIEPYSAKTKRILLIH